MKNLYVIVALAAIAGLLASVAEARRATFPARIWVTIDAHPDEGRWEACRRVYGRAVHRVRRGHGHTMRCWIDLGEVY